MFFFSTPIHYQAWKSQEMFYSIVFIWKKFYTPRMAWGWVNHGVGPIFIFGWTIP